MKNNDKKITRREAIEKTGKYAALTAAATFLILNPKKSQADSPANPGWSKANPSTTQNPEENMSNKA